MQITWTGRNGFCCVWHLQMISVYFASKCVILAFHLSRNVIKWKDDCNTKTIICCLVAQHMAKRQKKLQTRSFQHFCPKYYHQEMDSGNFWVEDELGNNFDLKSMMGFPFLFSSKLWQQKLLTLQGVSGRILDIFSCKL